MAITGSTVFISYRREDSAGYAGRLFDHLADKLGRDNVFRDVENIAPGEHFTDTIRKRLSICDALLVVIGPRWLTATDPQGRKRLDDEEDLVRKEIEFGLERKIRVIPILLPGTRMPGANELPTPLAPLAQFNAIEIREPYFEHDVAQLIKILGAPRRWSLVRLAHAKYLYPLLIGAALVLAVATFFWLNPPIFMTPERARLQIVAMGLNYNAATFVQKANAGDSATVKLFLRAGMSVNETPYNQTAIVAAAEEGHLPVVKALAEAGANINQAIVAAVRGKNRAVFDYLLSRNPSKESMAGALDVAAGSGNLIDVVRDLLDRGVDVNSDWGGTPLMSAAYHGNLDILELLLERGAQVKAVNKEGETPLHYAARGLSLSPSSTMNVGSTPSLIVGALLAGGAPVNAQDHAGRTPLMNGLESGEVTQLLLMAGADVKLQTKDGATALHYAVGRNVTWLIKPLIDHRAEVNIRNKRGETPLMFATGAIDSVDKPETAQILIDHGADVNLTDENGNTALMFAAQKGLANSIRILLQAHAKTATRNRNGQTALDIAKKSSREAIVKLLSVAR